MMLTMETAEHLKVANRLDPVQSIWGGAKYLKQLIERVPEEFQGQDRIAYALASYNVGIGHVRDAQTLAGILGKDPNSWIDIKEVLPLLSQKKYYKRLTKGYARGREPVLYVDRIFNYWDILEQESVLTSRM
jgi:membrane-bound lytic murein transglycosylase F